MRVVLLFLFLLLPLLASAQKTAADFGFRELDYNYRGSLVKVVVRSKKGEENIKKPILLYCQGSLPQPIIKYDDRGLFGVFPWGEDTFLDSYHIAIISKPGVPVTADASTLGKSYGYYPDGQVSDEYRKNNHLEYYTQRNIFVLDLLLKEPWADTNNLVIVGHSEGTYIAVKMASVYKRTSRLILSSGNPYGRILSIIAQNRYTGNDEHIFDYWKTVVADNNNDTTAGQSDSFKTTYSFSQPITDDLLNLKIPILFCYGTKDWSAPYNDLFQAEAIRQGRKNITFLIYRGLEHNYFPVDDKMQPDYNVYNWTKTGADWEAWLKKN